MKKIKKLSSTVLLVAVAIVLTMSVAIAKKDSNKGNKGDSSKSKSEKVKEFKDYEKPGNGKSNAAIHREKTDEVSAELTVAAEKEKNKGQENNKGQQQKEQKMEEKKINNPDVGEQNNKRVKIGEMTEEEVAEEMEEVAGETEKVQDETVEAINQVEKQNKFKKLLIGTDYKNLGQLRSSLVQNRNQIRQLARLSGVTEDEETQDIIEKQLTVLMQERERIKAVITENESGFSLLGWAFRLINGYPKDSIDEQEEEAFENEVADVLGANEEELKEDEDGDGEGEDFEEEGNEDSQEETSNVEKTDNI